MKKVGEILRHERQRADRSITDVSIATKIREEYIVALESSDLASLLGEIYVRGFVLSYARYLHLDTTKIMAFYRRERIETASTNPQYLSKVQKPKIEITPIKLFGIAITILILSFVVFLTFQYRQFSGTPLLIVDYPPDNLVTEANEILVSGKTDDTSKISINGQEIDVILGGNFSMEYTLTEGINKIRIIAVNRVGKKSIIERTVEQRTVNP